MSKRDGILALVALLSVVIYSLACRPAWHPSGKQVAFPFAEEEANRSGIALYDLETKEVTRLVEVEGEGLALAQCLWTSDGSRLIAVSATEEDDLLISAVDPARKEMKTITTLDGIEDPLLFIPPVLVEDRYLWLSGLTSGESGGLCLRVDLQEKKSERFFEGNKTQTVLYDFGERGFFYMSPSLPGNDDTSITLGTFDPVTGVLSQGTILAEGKEVSPFLAAESQGNRMVTVVGDDALLIFDEKGETLKTIPFPEWLDETGHLAWSGGLVWIATVRTVEEGDSSTQESGLMSVDVDSSEVHFVTLRSGFDAEEALLSLQPSVSPDGKWIAVSAVMMQEDPEVGLILVPLEGEHKPVRIPMPLWKTGEDSQAKEAPGAAEKAQ